MSGLNTSRACTKCGTEKPIDRFRHRTEFSERLQKMHTIIDHVCIDCQNASRRARYKKSKHLSKAEIIHNQHPVDVAKAKGWGWNPRAKKSGRLRIEVPNE